MMSDSFRSKITTDGWRTLLAVADVLIPQGRGRPNATAAPGYESKLEICLAARRDVIERVAEILTELSTAGDLETSLRSLDADRPSDLAVLGNIVAAAYFMIPEVAATTGYVAPHRNPAAYDEAVNELASGILEPVIDRGPVYRVAPD
jgi:hypothetical protein